MSIIIFRLSFLVLGIAINFGLQRHHPIHNIIGFEDLKCIFYRFNSSLGEVNAIEWNLSFNEKILLQITSQSTCSFFIK